MTEYQSIVKAVLLSSKILMYFVFDSVCLYFIQMTQLFMIAKSIQNLKTIYLLILLERKTALGSKRGIYGLFLNVTLIGSKTAQVSQKTG